MTKQQTEIQTAPDYMQMPNGTAHQLARIVVPWAIVGTWFVFSAFFVVSGLLS